ncbi:hypothetical protein JCM3766R1_001023 [Sporobolomyces carnicolor]
MIDPAILFNDAELSLVVPWPSAVARPPPRRSTLSPSTDPGTDTDTDDWIDSLLRAEQRSTAYYDEDLTFYLVVTLAATSLSRSQAHAFFLHSLQDPHLAVGNSLSYYESAATRPTLPRAQSALVSSQFPLTPNPYPSTSHASPGADPTTRESVLVSTKTFQDLEKEASARDEDNAPKVWVGRTSGGVWAGIWQFDSPLPFLQTSFHEPKLAVTVTVSFTDDPKLAKLLATHKQDSHVNGSSESVGVPDSNDEGEDYMDDSYDEVNLLSALSSSEAFHLPFSRLPPAFLPPLSSAPPPTHARRHSRTHSLNASSADAAVSSPSPLLRRSILRTLDPRKPLQLSIRTFDCSIPDGKEPAYPPVSAGDGQEVSSTGGMVVLLELVGPRDPKEQFRVDDIQVRATASRGGIESANGAYASDLEVRRVAETAASKEAEDEPQIRLGAHDQFNLVYKLALSPSSQQQQVLNPIIGSGNAAEGDATTSVPIGVATSPSQRFAARFGSAENEDVPDGYRDEEYDRRIQRSQERDRKNREDAFRRNLEIIVHGTILVRDGPLDEPEGYIVDENGSSSSPEREAAAAWRSPTRTLSSKWHYTIDISSIAYQPPPLPAHLSPRISDPSLHRPPARPTSIAAPQIPLLPSSALRPIAASASTATRAERAEYESVAGSKRHTMASLASLSLKSPVFGRKSSFTSLPPQQPTRPNAQRHASMRVSQAPSIATPGVTGGVATSAGGPRRFFSLPPASQDSIPTSRSATPTNANFFVNRSQTETPPPIVSTSPAVARNSLPLPTPAHQNPETNRRTSWMSGLGIGKPSTTIPKEGVTSWDTLDPGPGGKATSRESAGLGLGLDTAGANSPLPPLPQQASLPPRPSEIDQHVYHQYNQPMQNGRILVTVSLVPLRAVKSRRHLDRPPVDGANAEAANLPPATLPGLTPTLSPPASHHASFAFPTSTPTSPSSLSPVGSPSIGPYATDSNAFPEAERTALSTSRMPRVGLLDVFLVQLFVVNQTDQVKRFVVGVPSKHSRNSDDDGGGKPRGQDLGIRGVDASRERHDQREGGVGDFATLVPLENDVRIGPLAPDSCASLGLRMLAIAPGAHVLDELKLVDLADGSETRLQKPLWVVVE